MVDIFGKLLAQRFVRRLINNSGGVAPFHIWKRNASLEDLHFKMQQFFIGELDKNNLKDYEYVTVFQFDFTNVLTLFYFIFEEKQMVYALSKKLVEWAKSKTLSREEVQQICLNMNVGTLKSYVREHPQITSEVLKQLLLPFLQEGILSEQYLNELILISIRS